MAVNVTVSAVEAHIVEIREEADSAKHIDDPSMLRNIISRVADLAINFAESRDLGDEPDRPPLTHETDEADHLARVAQVHATLAVVQALRAIGDHLNG